MGATRSKETSVTNCPLMQHSILDNPELINVNGLISEKTSMSSLFTY